MNYCLTLLVSKHASNLYNAYLDLMDDEEEVLLVLAEVLGSFLEFIGGPAHVVTLFKPLEKLC
jgi:hypothetical protein